MKRVFVFLTAFAVLTTSLQAGVLSPKATSVPGDDDVIFQPENHDRKVGGWSAAGPIDGNNAQYGGVFTADFGNGQEVEWDITVTEAGEYDFFIHYNNHGNHLNRSVALYYEDEGTRHVMTSWSNIGTGGGLVQTGTAGIAFADAPVRTVSLPAGSYSLGLQSNPGGYQGGGLNVDALIVKDAWVVPEPTTLCLLGLGGLALLRIRRPR